MFVASVEHSEGFGMTIGWFGSMVGWLMVSRLRSMIGGRGVVWGGWVSHIGGGRCWMGWKGGHVGMDGAVIGRGGCHASKKSHELQAYHRYLFTLFTRGAGPIANRFVVMCSLLYC